MAREGPSRGKTSPSRHKLKREPTRVGAEPRTEKRARTQIYNGERGGDREAVEKEVLLWKKHCTGRQECSTAKEPMWSRDGRSTYLSGAAHEEGEGQVKERKKSAQRTDRAERIAASRRKTD